MAVVGISLSVPADRGRPALKSTPRIHEAKTSFASSTQSAGTAADGEYWRISTDTAIWVAFGTNPTASSANDFYIPAGGTDYFQGVAGEKAAIIAA